MIQIYSTDFIAYLEEAAAAIAEKKDYITGLDARTGDGDHWLNLNIGFEVLKEKQKEWVGLQFEGLFKNIAMCMMSAMGGSSGVLYGSAYLDSSRRLAGKEVLADADLADMLEGWEEAISRRGGVKAGYKTMLDAVAPAARAYRRALDDGKESREALGELKSAAVQGAENTRNMEAVKGRASYQTNKGVGELDPGAITMAMQLECLADYLSEHCVVDSK